MQSLTQHPKDRLWLIGLSCLACSLFFFCIPYVFENQHPGEMNLFIANFMSTAGYFLAIWIGGKLRRGRNGIHHMFIFLILFFISAWALNREMTIFEESVSWFAGLQVIICVNYIAFAWFHRFSPVVQHVCCFILGVAIIAFLYLAFYLAPLYAISAAAAPLLGISLHAFVPLLFLIYTIVLVVKVTDHGKKYWISFLSGSASVVVIVIVAVVQWAQATSEIDTTYRKASVQENEGLPEWIAVSQKIPQSGIAKKVLKADMVYSVPNKFNDLSMFRIPTRNFGEERKHDPLVMVCALFGGTSVLSAEERIKVLESSFNARHQAQERLWTGDHLYTDNVQTVSQIWPQLSMAYTETTVTVTNVARRSGRQEEGIYTFYLPEGSVVTSLSLWIEGREEKAILTTKEKAADAYKTIVGYEARDPSVVHWQEGNTVSVRVFPVMGGKSRKFKMGITSPLANRNQKLVYENIHFDGPNALNATEDVTIEFKNSPKDFVLPAVFHSESPRVLKRSGRYQSSWRLEFGVENISTGSFSFDGNVYAVRPYQKQRGPVQITEVYLDINSSWTSSELNDVMQLLVNKTVFVFSDKMIRVTDKNKEKLFSELLKHQFSLFPFHKISRSETALVISKSTAVSPNIKDVTDTRFVTNLKKHFARAEKTRLFNLGNDLSPYLRTLKEYRAFQYEHGDIALLKQLLVESRFASDIENDDQVIVDNAELAIVRSDGAMPSTAPDHLMRLFSYNHILQKMGTRFFTGDSLNLDLAAEARKAYVVSPVSSLVVLESQEDYERFGIHDEGASLKNASTGSSGAVPEPHEWALIIIALLVLAYLKFQPVVNRIRS